jgi:hypothetical protein
MGDAITTPFDVFVFVLIFVGIPTLIFGMPIAVLGFLSVRRKIQLNAKRNNETLDSRLTPASSNTNSKVSSSGLPWLVALILLIAVAAIVYLISGAPLSRIFLMSH